MHDTAYETGKLFFEMYGHPGQTIVENGSYNVNGTLRDFCPDGATYLGLDFSKGPGVDIFIEEGKPIPLRDEFADIVVSSSALEHDCFFWETFLEMARVLKPGGALYVNAPSNGSFHRYPIDCWRFYPDSGRALVALARRRGYAFTLVESFTAERKSDHWNDFVAIFVKAEASSLPEPRFLSDAVPCTNVIRMGVEEIGRLREASEDMSLIANLRAANRDLEATLAEEKAQAQKRAETLEAEHLAQIAARDDMIARLQERVEALERSEETADGS